MEAGRLLFEALGKEETALVCLGALELACEWIPPSNTIRKLLRLKQKKASWSAAYNIFHEIRTNTIKLDSLASSGRITSEASNLHILNYLAENVAKVVSNAVVSSDEFEFDEDSKEWAVRCLYDCIAQTNEVQFFEDAEKFLFSDE